MPERRQVIVYLGLGASGALAQPAPPTQVPPLSAATPGASIAAGWRHQPLPNVERSNQFAIVTDEGQRVLRITSSASASPWLARLDIDTARSPWLHWRWRVSHSLAGSDLRRRGGADYAARLYVVFDLAAERLPLSDRLRIQATRLLSGAEVPAAALCYVWGHAQAVVNDVMCHAAACARGTGAAPTNAAARQARRVTSGTRLTSAARAARARRPVRRPARCPPCTRHR